MAQHVTSMRMPSPNSDSSDDSISPMKEKVTCILRSSSSSSEESVDSTVDGRNVGQGKFKSCLELEHPNVLDLLNTLCIKDMDKVYLSKSLMKDWRIKGRCPLRLLGDVCIVSRTRPVTLISFVKDLQNEDEVIKYNAKVARYLVSEVRERLYGSFSLVSGALGLTSCQSEDTFRKEINSLDEDAKLCSVPGWLHMDPDRCEHLVEIIDKLHVQDFEFGGATEDPYSTPVCVEKIEEREINQSSELLCVTKQERVQEQLRRSVRHRKKTKHEYRRETIDPNSCPVRVEKIEEREISHSEVLLLAKKEPVQEQLRRKKRKHFSQDSFMYRKGDLKSDPISVTVKTRWRSVSCD